MIIPERENTKTILRLDDLSLSLLRECEKYTRTKVRALTILLANEILPEDNPAPMGENAVRKSYAFPRQFLDFTRHEARKRRITRDAYINLHIHAIAPRYLAWMESSVLFTDNKGRRRVGADELPQLIAECTQSKTDFSVEFPKTC